MVRVGRHRIADLFLSFEHELGLFMVEISQNRVEHGFFGQSMSL